VTSRERWFVLTVMTSCNDDVKQQLYSVWEGDYLDRRAEFVDCDAGVAEQVVVEVVADAHDEDDGHCDGRLRQLSAGAVHYARVS